MRAHGLYFLLTSFILYSFIGSCSENRRGVEPGSRSGSGLGAPVIPGRGGARITEPSPGEILTRGDMVGITLEFNDGKSDRLSSVALSVDGREEDFSGTVPGTIYWDSSDAATGNRQLLITLSYDDGSRENYPLGIVLRSDIVPDQYTYRIVNSYPHDIRAFTQGLVYDNGHFYESTGEYGRSTLRKVVAETGEVVKSLNLSRDLWGEGLSLHDNKLYQLTWKSRVGFIYDKETFRLLGRVHYQTEGWGLTSDGKNLYMTDGSHNIYVMDPGYFTEIRRIEVYDDKGKVENLNELEMIGGLIYANVFTTDDVVIIEPETGRVTGRIDFTGLLDRQYHHRNLDVLNGIAYDSENDRIFVTGKNWPRLFEIKPVLK
jgi:glutaminyl-peptide cyclotransferase